MNKTIFSILFSTRLMAILFLVFAGAMAAGTFIEDAYNTDVARKIIYNTWWFEVIMVFFVINFFGNIKRYQLYKKEKWATLLLHLSFILILIGAFVTRYISFEGMMPIREGETENVFYSDKTFLTLMVDGEYQGEMKRKTFEKNVLLTAKNSFFANNDFSIKNDFNGIPFEIEYEDFIMNAKETLEPNESGQYYMKLVESSNGSRHEHYLREGEVQNIHNILYAFNKFTQGAVNITKIEDAYTIQTPFEGDFMRMADKFQGKVQKDSAQVLMLRSLYNLGVSQFVLPEPAIKGNLVNKSNNDFKDKTSDDVLIVKIKSQGKEEKLSLTGSVGKQGIPQSVKVGALEFTMFYGSKVYELPISIKLDDFIADKKPGTERDFAAFKSKLEITDKRANKVFKDSVFMNNVLDYDGYRFFQAGFDPDEKGTNLSVSHDFWGTWISYIGYFLLYIGLMAILFDKNTRFADLKRKLEKTKEKRSKLVMIGFLLFSSLSFSQHNHNENETSASMPDAAKALEFIKKYNVSQEHADNFGKLVIQDAGRLIPVNTFSSKLLRKVSKSDTFEGMDSDQVLLSMTQFPEYWYQIPIIYLKRGNDSIRKIAGIDKDAKYASLMNFIDDKGNYKLSPFLDEAYAAPVPNQFQKDFRDIDQKISLLNSALGGYIIKVFPIPNDDNNKWVSYLELDKPTGTSLDTIKNVMPYYLNATFKSSQSKDYTLPNSLLTGLTKYQKLYGAKVMPSDQKIEYEIMYNKYDIFKKLHYWYMLAGILMLLFTIIGMFNNKKWINYTVNGFHVLIGIFFTLHTVGLIVRWYISGHAPWSDAYESMIYVAWATMFFGLAFDRKSKLTVASAAFVVSMILMVAHWNWLDPEIGTLQPVLNSYWLMIHVAVIVASYGPFTLAMMLGLVALFLMIFTSEKNKERMKLSIQELTYINELALTVGLVMLTIGNFLGGQWANESWGRYWGWDPKETWALISIMIYAFVIHARFVPTLRGLWVYNFMSVLAFASILMTYFGVNFHLSGMHSYASGEKQNVTYYFYILAVVLVIAFFALSKYRKYYKK
jgi:cytochrome c-type biogenesis protein CcsB